MSKLLCLLCVLLGLLCALPTTEALYQGKYSSSQWVFEDSGALRADPVALRRFKESPLTFIVALKLRDTERMHEEFLSVSNPKSAKYGQFYSPKDLAAAFGPKPEAREKVLTFFRRMPGASLSIGEHGDLLEVTAPVESIEEFLHTQLGFVAPANSNSNKKKSVRAMTDLHIPEYIAEHLSFVSLNTPVMHAKTRGARAMKEQEREERKRKLLEGVKAAEATVSTINGNKEAIIRFKVTCGDGTPNESSPPCADQPANLPTFSFTFTQHANDPENPYLLTTEPQVFTVPSTALYCYNSATGKTCAGNDGTACTCLTKISPLPMYTQLRVNVTATFPADSGNVQPVGQSSYFALTDVATARFLSELYKMPAGLKVNHGSNQSVAEFYNEFYSNTDLAKFMALSGLPNATIPPENVYGTLANDYSDPGGEAQLDVEYLMAMAPGADTFFYSMADYNPYDVVNQTNEGFLAYLQIVDEQEYPPLVHSMSYGDLEGEIFNASNPGSADYASRCDEEFKQMGLRGLTIVFSSGDDGIGSSMIRTDKDRACSQAWPEWPASSPYVTAIGATQLTDKYLPICGLQYAAQASIPEMPQLQQLVAQCSGTGETVCSSVQGGVITSGGGFSNVHDRATTAPWQVAAVETYLSPANSAAYPPLSYFNAAGRAYPDISTYGSNYFVYLNDQITRESGTSASAPVFAAMVTLWNDMRLAYKMPPMGFIAPFLYDIYATHPEAFNDVVTGDNACGVGGTLDNTRCCEYSFAASPGWDAVTGLGTPNFQVISNLVLNVESPFPSLGAFPNGESTQAVQVEDDDSLQNETDMALGIGIAGLALAGLTCFAGIFCLYRASKQDRLLG